MFCKIISICCFGCFACFETSAQLIHNDQQWIQSDQNALIQMYQNYPEKTATRVSKTSTNESEYGYGTASVTIITALAFSGILVIPLIGSRFYILAMQSFIALGIGSLSGDALFHLFPYVLGIHSDENYEYLWKMCVCIAGIWFLFFIESFTRILGNKHKEVDENDHQVHNHHMHDHSVFFNQTFSDQDTRVTSFSKPDQQVSRQDETQDTNDDSPSVKTIEEKDENKTNIQENSNVARTSKAQYCGLPVLAFMIFIGDALHNFADGLAIGVAFSGSWVTGVGTSLAIFCHELPHEFSDFALYLNCGVSKAKALALNFAAACCCYVGMFIGIAVSSDDAFRPWITAFIAGVFVYISFVDVLPEMWNVSTTQPWLCFLLQNLGMALGWILLLLLARFEEDIENSI